jgi:hypothetical protein
VHWEWKEESGETMAIGHRKMLSPRFDNFSNFSCNPILFVGRKTANVAEFVWEKIAANVANTLLQHANVEV